MERVTDCQNMCQRPEGRICTHECIILEETQGLSVGDDLLWQALQVIAPLRPMMPLVNEIEKYFGVNK